MTKTQTFIVWGVISVGLVWLLWRSRSDIAPTVFNTPPPTYLDVAYPTMPALDVPALQQPVASKSCGCNPAASQFMSGVANKIAAAENEIDKQLSDYTDSINAYFATQFVQ